MRVMHLYACGARSLANAGSRTHEHLKRSNPITLPTNQLTNLRIGKPSPIWSVCWTVDALPGVLVVAAALPIHCLLYTSDAADE